MPSRALVANGPQGGPDHARARPGRPYDPLRLVSSPPEALAPWEAQEAAASRSQVAGLHPSAIGSRSAASNGSRSHRIAPQDLQSYFDDRGQLPGRAPPTNGTSGGGGTRAPSQMGGRDAASTVPELTDSGSTRTSRPGRGGPATPPSGQGPYVSGPRPNDAQGGATHPTPLHAARQDAGSTPPLSNGFVPSLDPPAPIRTAAPSLEAQMRYLDGTFPYAPPVRPASAHPTWYDQRYDSSGRTRSYDSAVDQGARALMADLRHRASTGGPDLGLARIMTPPPPPPPPRTPPPPPPPPPPPHASDGHESSIERQSSFQVPPPPHHGAFDQKGPPSRDIERLLSCITPVLEFGGELATGKLDLRSLRLADVWQFFEEASVYGREVYTRAGRRGPALAYYTPTLSAIRVLLPCQPPEGQDAAVHARALVQHFEAELPFNREPFMDAMGKLAAGRNTADGRWQDTLLTDLHPASWFAVAWYPIYRIPDAPLTAKFLTFHSLRPSPACHTYFGVAQGAPGPPESRASEEGSPLCLPILGLKCAEQKSEQWFESYHRDAGPSDWEKRHQHLQAAASSLSAGKDLRLQRPSGEWQAARSNHSDLEWFSRHP